MPCPLFSSLRNKDNEKYFLVGWSIVLAECWIASKLDLTLTVQDVPVCMRGCGFNKLNVKTHTDTRFLRWMIISPMKCEETNLFNINIV